MRQALVHASQLFTGDGFRKKDGRRPSDADTGLIEDGAVVFSSKKRGRIAVPDKILWAGKTSDLPKKFARVKKKNLKNKQAVTAGWIDCHTHLVFAGDRASEFARRAAGESYESIAKSGGGILSTIIPTREAKVTELEALAIKRVKEAYSYGVRTIEVKSGYGLTTESEIKCLEVVQRLKKKFPLVTFKSTFLGAHAFPKEVSRAAYLDEITKVMIPEIARRELADACDVFVDEGYFTVEEAKKILGVAKENGLQIKLHGDELVNTESAALGASLDALSVDHLLKVSDEGIKALAESQTVGVVLPGTAFYLKEKYAPAKRLIDAGACVAISTDFNPGSSMVNNLPAIMTLSALYMGMNRAEILAGVTYNAAKALSLQDQKGTIEEGMDADLTILPFQTFEEAYYRFAWAPN